ncbi:MAG: WYL domain-containing transcriptional regulator [Bacteroidota bacterium]
MGKEHEDRTKVRILRVMMALLDRPFGYTKRDLSEMTGYSPDTIKHDFDCFRNVGLVLKRDDKHRYAFQESQPYKQLKNLLHFSEDDQYLLEQAIDQVSAHSKQGKRLKKKLHSLYDYHLLGHSYLRKPYLSKVDLLLQAKEEQKQAKLIDYPSSHSNSTQNRQVEPFHVSPPDDMLHAFDVEKKKLRHFRISRIKRVKLLDTSWEYPGHHRIIYTDPFRIVSEGLVTIHLRLSVGARNELIERFPNTLRHIEPAAEEDMFDFQCEVNNKFFGIANFILGSYVQGVEVLSPDSLKEHLRGLLRKMEF